MAISDYLESTSESSSGSQADQIREQYRISLGRDAADSEVEYWINWMNTNNKSFGEILSGISNSREAQTYKLSQSEREGEEDYRGDIDTAIKYSEGYTAMAAQALQEADFYAKQGLYDMAAKSIAIAQAAYTKAQDYYAPYTESGKRALSELEKLGQGGVRTGPIEQSPYYGLYKWQQNEQNKSLNQALGSRGLWNSGYGITEQVKSDTGLGEKMAATEYERAVEDYNRRTGIYGNLANYGMQGATGGAQAALSTGKTMADILYGTGQTAAGISTGTGAGLASLYSGQGKTGASLYGQMGSQLYGGGLQTALANMDLFKSMYGTDVNAATQRYVADKSKSGSGINWGALTGSVAGGILGFLNPVAGASALISGLGGAGTGANIFSKIYQP